MDKKKLILVGGGGNCKVVLSILEKIDNLNVVGIIDQKSNIGRSLKGIKIIGTDEDLSDIYRSGVQYGFVTVGSIKSNLRRFQLFSVLKTIGYELPIIISPDTIIDKNTKIGEGTVIMPGSIINVDSEIGKNCIINSGATIEHDCKIGNHCHIAPGVNISGGINIGDLSFIGTGATVIHGIQIGRNVTIGAGSVVIKDIPDNAIAVGNPSRMIGKNNLV